MSETPNLYPWQREALAYVTAWHASSPPGARLLVAAPTGTGKGTLALALRQALGAMILTPSREIIRGFHERDPAARVDTPTSHRNQLVGGLAPPTTYILDEGHHHVLDNILTGDIYAVNPDARWIGLTATPYRGSASGTAALREAWGEPWVAYTIHEAVTDGTMAIPEVQVIPVWDDDTLRVSGGEFVIRSSDRKARSLVHTVAEYAAGLTGPRVVAVPGRESAVALADALGCPVVMADTPAPQRSAAYDHAREGGVFVQISVVSEGWDAPWLRHYVDCHPTMSPVRWMQVVGRLCRPGTDSVYHCLCRNLERHAYLLAGHVPPSVVRESQRAHGAPLTRSVRARVGLETVGRLKALPVPLADGTLGTMYGVYSVSEGGVREYAVILLPGVEAPLVATRFNVRHGDTTTYARWERTSLPPDFVGYATSRWRGEPSEKQRAWWQRAAARYGLDPAAEVTAREFQILPVLADLGICAEVTHE